jgi:hypothetical protein
MSSPAAAHRPSLSSTVLRVAAVAAVAAVLIWSVLFVDLVRKHSDAAAAVSPPGAQIASPDSGQPAQAPAPVTTRTS